MRETTRQTLRAAYHRARPLSAAPTKTATGPTAGELRPGDTIWWKGHRLTITTIDVTGYGHRRGATYRRLRLRGTIASAPDEQQTAYYASDEPIER